MRTELRFLLAIVLMVGVLVGTNLLFPPVPPEPPVGPGSDTAAVAGDTGAPEAGTAAGEAEGEEEGEEPGRPAGAGPGTEEEAPELPDAVAEEEPEDLELPSPGEEAPGEEEEERRIVVESPLYRYTFSTRGARLVSAELLDFPSFTRDGPVQLIPEGSSALGHRVVVGSDTVDLRELPFEASPAEGLRLDSLSGAQVLSFVYRHPTGRFELRLDYTFRPGGYLTTVRGEVGGIGRGTAWTDLGDGLAFNEHRREDDLQALAYVGNHLQEGIQSENLREVEEEFRIWDGPFRWAAFKNKYFVFALLPGVGEVEEGVYLGGLVARNLEDEARVALAATQSVGRDGVFGYRLFMGPQEFARLTALGDDLEDVNPYGWRFFRPVIRPLVGIVMTALTFLHDTLGWGYGWVLILFGVMMRVIFFPLHQKAMRAQLRNMAVQPLLKEIQTKYKDDPERLQKEMMKLYKEHGFNPLAGCLPMLLPWPILITLFFVFQNTIELRGVPFLWLPDLSSPDPLYILPAILGISMFGLQYVSYRSMDEPNPQLKMMMWIMPAVMVFIFLNFAAGLNLYYATANIATLPQQFWIANERKKHQKKKPVMQPAE